MSDFASRFSKRLTSLLRAQGSAMELHTVTESDEVDDAIEVHAGCHADPVLQPPPEVEQAGETIGPWDRRGVRLVVRIASDSPRLSAELTYATSEADDAGDRSVTFGWEFDDGDTAGIAEMKFNDRRTFKLDYFSVLPPRYVSEFLTLCQQVYNDTSRD